MDPDGLNPRSQSLQFSDSISPSFGGYEEYEQFKQNALMRNSMKSIASEKAGYAHRATNRSSSNNSSAPALAYSNI